MEENDISRKVVTRIPTENGEFTLHLFYDSVNNKEHLAFTMGELDGFFPPLVRIHSECLPGMFLVHCVVTAVPSCHQPLK